MKKTILIVLLAVASCIMLASCSISQGSYTIKDNQSTVSPAEMLPDARAELSSSDGASMLPYAISSETSAGTMSNFDRPAVQVYDSPASASVAVPVHAIVRGAQRRANAEANGTAGESTVSTSGTSATTQSVAAAPVPQGSGGVPKWFLVVCCILLPPLAVALVFGITDKFWIDLALTFCFWLPGVIYAFIQIF